MGREPNQHLGRRTRQLKAFALCGQQRNPDSVLTTTTCAATNLGCRITQPRMTSNKESITAANEWPHRSPHSTASVKPLARDLAGHARSPPSIALVLRRRAAYRRCLLRGARLAVADSSP